MILESWGRYPKTSIESVAYSNQQDVIDLLATEENIICYGNGRSYGDCGLNKKVLHTINNNRFIDFDQINGILHCQSGVLLADILDAFVNRGWFLPVTPGTKYVTVGGAVSSDVHGKNQHQVGSFCDFVMGFRLLLADGSNVECSRDNHVELFHAACGGMGLMGVILDVSLQLKAITSSFIRQKLIRTNNLQQTIEVFESSRSSFYSVAWLDCQSAGRGVVSLGEHDEEGGFCWQPSKTYSIPTFTPGWLLNPLSSSLFNATYYYLNKSKDEQRISIDDFFYPLDKIDNWNRLYGRSGFLQYQFVIPKGDGLQGLSKIFNAIANGSFCALLAVLKVFDQGNSNYLSFPHPGYSLAVDFKMTNGLLAFLENLDRIVLEYGGRLYLAKDARMTQATFDAGYPKAEKVRALRRKYGLANKFQSEQSRRLGL